MSRQDALRALVDHWRTVAEKVVDSGYATATRLCADDLERALLSGGGDAELRRVASEIRYFVEQGVEPFPDTLLLWAEAIDAAMPTTPEASK